MSDPNSVWLINQKNMDPCCYQSLQYEGYRRKEAKEELMVQGQRLKCSTCGSEMVCETGDSGRLRWGMKKGESREAQL